MRAGEALKAALLELQLEHRRHGRHGEAHKMVTAQAALSEENAERLLQIMLAGFRQRGQGTELEHIPATFLSIPHQRQPLAITNQREAKQ